MTLVRRWWVDGVALAVAGIVFLVPFAFILVTAGKDQAEASLLDFTWPTEWHFWENTVGVLTARDGIVVTSLKNSFILTVSSVALIVVASSMVAFVHQRRKDRVSSLVSVLVLAGLIIPPAVVPTIFVLQALGLFKTLIGLILIELAFLMPFSVLVLRAFIGSIPREIDEAAIVDGAVGVHAVLPCDLSLDPPRGHQCGRGVGGPGLHRFRQPALLPARF